MEHELLAKLRLYPAGELARPPGPSKASEETVESRPAPISPFKPDIYLYYTIFQDENPKKRSAAPFAKILASGLVRCEKQAGKTTPRCRMSVFGLRRTCFISVAQVLSARSRQPPGDLKDHARPGRPLAPLLLDSRPPHPPDMFVQVSIMGKKRKRTGSEAKGAQAGHSNGGEETEALLSPELQEELAAAGSGQDVIITGTKSKKNDAEGLKRKLDARGRAMEDEVMEHKQCMQSATVTFATVISIGLLLLHPAVQVLQDAKKMSKRQKKRLLQIQERKAKEERRAALYQTLEEQKMSDEHLKLLKSSKDYTQKVGRSPTGCMHRS